ncbi:glycosyltransferase family 2 protein, partial [Thomasclavelia cocleata]|uniref:glycosyltransferase family 2 protein n=2 Tax=Thomasclavelia cocleata TaxID=69824 RepID=UPI00242EF9F3
MISLIIPCFNGEGFLNRCLDSVLSQTYKEIELILINDGSTDSSQTIIENRRKEIEETISKFIFINQKNQGVGASCNIGFKYATGQYLCLLDVDDVLLPSSLEEQKKWLDNHNDFDLVRTNGFYVNEEQLESNKNLFEVNHDMKLKENIFSDIFHSTTYLWPGTYMIRMKLLNKIYPDREIYPSRSGQNLQFLMMATYFSKAGFIDKPLMKYTIRKESLSHFTDGDVKKRKINALLGYKDIRNYLINSFFQGDEKEFWLKQNELLYARVFMKLAVDY